MLKGIDVCSGNGAIDWRKVKQAGNAFAYVRAAYGDVADNSAAPNLRGARAAGLKRGVYHFLRTGKNYQAQIDLMLALLETLQVGRGDLPPALHVDGNPRVDGPWNPASNDKFITAADRWVAAVHERTGAWPLIYTRAGFWEELGNPTTFGNCPLWVASYRLLPPRLPPAWNKFTFWQYSDRGRVAGVLSLADMNYFDGADARELNSLLLP
jgi:lysozyme